MKKEKAIFKNKIFMLGGLALTVGLGLTATAQGGLTFEKVRLRTINPISGSAPSYPPPRPAPFLA